MELVSVGDNCLDVYLDDGWFVIGGNALNVAVGWNALGHRSRYVGAVGDDRAAREVRNAVESVGLDSSTVRTLPGQTGVTFLRLDNGDRIMLHEEFGVGLDLRLHDDEIDELARANWTHVQGTAPEAEIVERLVRAGASVSVDLSTRYEFDGLEGVRVAFASLPDAGDDDAILLAENIRSAGAEIAVVTRGDQGAVALTTDALHHQSAMPVSAIDTCGAGDSFIVGFTSALAMGRTTTDAAARGARCAAQTCLHRGGFPQPDLPAGRWLHDLGAAVGVTPQTTEY